MPFYVTNNFQKLFMANENVMPQLFPECFHLVYLILFETYLNSHYTFIPSLHKFFCVKNVAIQMSSKGCAYLYYKHVSSPTLSL